MSGIACAMARAQLMDTGSSEHSIFHIPYSLTPFSDISNLQRSARCSAVKFEVLHVFINRSQDLEAMIRVADLRTSKKTDCS